MCEDERVPQGSRLRLQLDVALRFHAAWLVSNPHDFANEVWKGTPVRKLKDRDGNKMTDFYLVEKLSGEFPWIKKVYEKTSGFIHLSEKHIHSAFESTGEKKHEGLSVRIRISSRPEIPRSLYLELIKAFLASTKVFAWYLDGWLKTKTQKAKEPSLKSSKQ